MKVTLRVVSNLSFTAKFETTKPLKTLKFSGVLCFQRVKKGSYGNIHGNVRILLKRPIYDFSLSALQDRTDSHLRLLRSA